MAEHFHMYQAFGRVMYRCIDIDCPHTLHRDLLIRRKAKCPLCGNIFVITSEHLRRKTLRCLVCTKPKPEETPEVDTMSPFRDILREKGLL